MLAKLRPTPAPLCLALAALEVLGCGGGAASSKAPQAQQRLSVRGSDTMVMLAQRWAEAFRQAQPQVHIEVSGGGSGTGIAALRNGTTDLATASRAMQPTEKRDIEAAFPGQQVQEHVVAIDAIALYVHPSNPLPALHLPQLSQLFRGQVHNFAAVGGDRRPIVLYSRESSSGTYVYFKEHVLGKHDFAAEVQTLPGTAAVIHAVQLDPHGVGYGGIGYARGVRIVPLANDAGEQATPTAAMVQQGRYPLARPLFIYRLSGGTTTGESFIRWIKSRAGQRLVQQAGAFPVAEAT